MLDGSNKPTITADRMSAAKPAIAFSGFDQPFHSVNARMAGEVSPLALGQASTDWGRAGYPRTSRRSLPAMRPRKSTGRSSPFIQLSRCTIPVLVWSVGNQPARQEDYDRARRPLSVLGKRAFGGDR
jgi:hypothetical protein